MPLGGKAAAAWRTPSAASKRLTAALNSESTNQNRVGIGVPS
jgi:hypothetical protein